MAPEQTSRILRRLTEADGYLDLEMPEQALEILADLDDAGPLEPAAQFLRGEALKAQHNYEAAIEPLHRAAESIPAPHNQQAWLSLSECFRHGGQHVLADVVEMFAREYSLAK